ncbi:DUF2956 domain-containing protein [Vibrio tritonius]
MKTPSTPSIETQNDAMKMAKATQRPGQTKEQTKLIAQGIEKGIALYKKQQKEKSRQADKAKKKAQKLKTSKPAQVQPEVDDKATEPNHTLLSRLPWALLIVSWIGFIVYVISTTK